MQVTSVFPSLTVYENVWLSAQRTLGRPSAIRGRDGLEEVAARAHECLELAGIDSRAHEPAGSIGHGDQRLLEIAIALALRPKLLLLDEPTAGMSVRESWEIVRRLREIRARDRLTVVIVEHDMEIVMELAERITVLHLGQVLAQGTPDEIARNVEVQRVYLTGR
jgi:branched-chain amino acid transport system ATP-binding protein